MTIRVRDQLTEFDLKRIAAAVTHAVLHPAQDDSPSPARPTKAGTGWVRWTETLGLPRTTHLD